MDIFNNAQKAWLLLEDGTIYEGYGLGCSEDAIGELVFNTGVVGFQEILTDPANANNIIVETFPLEWQLRRDQRERSARQHHSKGLGQYANGARSLPISAARAESTSSLSAKRSAPSSIWTPAPSPESCATRACSAA